MRPNCVTRPWRRWEVSHTSRLLKPLCPRILAQAPNDRRLGATLKFTLGGGSFSLRVGTRLATPRTFLLLRGSSVTERLRVAGNADWQEKRVSRCWPSVNGGTSGLEYGAGKPPPLYCQVLHAGSRSGPPSTSLRDATVTGRVNRLTLPRPRPSRGAIPAGRGYIGVGAGGVPSGRQRVTSGRRKGATVTGGHRRARPGSRKESSQPNRFMRRLRRSFATRASQRSRGPRSRAASSPRSRARGLR
jgi:hypothetical protein